MVTKCRHPYLRRGHSTHAADPAPAATPRPPHHGQASPECVDLGGGRSGRIPVRIGTRIAARICTRTGARPKREYLPGPVTAGQHACTLLARSARLGTHQGVYTSGYRSAAPLRPTFTSSFVRPAPSLSRLLAGPLGRLAGAGPTPAVWVLRRINPTNSHVAPFQFSCHWNSRGNIGRNLVLPIARPGRIELASIHHRKRRPEPSELPARREPCQMIGARKCATPTPSPRTTAP